MQYMPDASPQMNGRGILAAALSVGIAIFLWYCSATIYGGKSWDDAIDYAVTAKSLVLHGHFPYTGISYEEALVSGITAYKTTTAIYPNLGFMFACGFIGMLRQDFSPINAMYLNLGFTLLTAALLYRIASTLTRNRLWGLSIVPLFFIQEDVFRWLGAPMTDCSLIFFALASAWCMWNGNERLSGLFLGIGFLFREQAMFLAPFLPLLHPAAADSKHKLFSRANAKRLFDYVAFFSAFFLSAKAAQIYFLAGSPASDFSVQDFTRMLKIERPLPWWDYFQKITGRILTKEYLPLPAIILMFACKRLVCILPKIVKIVPFFIWALLCFFFYTWGMPEHCIVLLCIAFFIFQGPIPRQSKLLIFIGIIQFIILCFLWSLIRDDIPRRYFTVSILFVFIAIYMIISISRLRTSLFILCFLFFILTPQTRSSIYHFLYRPITNFENYTFADVKTAYAFPKQQGDCLFPDGSIVLGGMWGNWRLAAYVAEHAIPGAAPDFDFFIINDNKNISGIFIREEYTRTNMKGWDGKERFSDAFGNMFERVAIPENLKKYIGGHAFYKKVGIKRE